MSATWHYGRLEGDHIVTTEPIEPHMDYHAPYMTWYHRIPYMTWYHRITSCFITPIDDFGPMRYQTIALSAHFLVCIILILCTYCV